MIRLGLVGTGRIGRLHTETLRSVPGACLAAITDTNLEAAAALGLPVAPDFESLLADDSLQAVVICSSTPTHAPFIEAAARAGKHIFCEKPIDLDLERVDGALAAVKAAGVQLMVGFNRRFDPNHVRVREAIASGEIGEPHLLHIVSRDPAPPPMAYLKVSGGIFCDMTIHDFDMARFLVGEVEELYCAGAVRVDPRIGEAGDVDTALIMLRFANGCLGTIDNSRQAVYGYDQRVEVFGSRGAARTENMFGHQVTVSRVAGVDRGRPLNFFMQRYLESYRTELTAFVNALTRGEPVPVTGEDGRAPLLMARAALQSLRENRPVRL